MPRLRGRIDPDGAVIPVAVALGAAEAGHLRATHQPIPPPFHTMALIDTGASRSTLHPMIVAHLGLMPRGFLPAHVPGAPGQPARNVRLFDVRITLGPPRAHRPSFSVQAVEVVPATQTVLVLIGRDLLEGSRSFSTARTGRSAFGSESRAGRVRPETHPTRMASS